MKVRLSGSFRESAGASQLDVSLPEGASLGDLLKHLTQRFGGEFANILSGKSGVTDDFVVSLDGEVRRDPNVKLADGQTVGILTLAVGG